MNRPLCRVPRCAVQLLPGQLMCNAHWTRVPEQVRTRVVQARRDWTDAAVNPTPTAAESAAQRVYVQALDDAVLAVLR